MSSQGTADPSPAEIAAACLEIQRDWTPDERLRRLRVDLRPYVYGADRCQEHDMAADDYDEHHSERELITERIER